MWYEILPTMGIILAGVGIPPVLVHYLHSWATGSPYWRDRETKDHMHIYLRDTRLHKNPYKVVGLESLPDEEEK